MKPAGDIRIVVAGPMGAGKSTAIRGVGDGVTAATEVPLRDGDASGAIGKARSTVVLDYGLCPLPEGRMLKIFGTPGQERFRFMRDAFGLIVLADNRRSEPIAEVARYLADFVPLAAPRAVVGVGWLGTACSPALEAYSRGLHALGFQVPVIDVDVRRVADVQLLLSVLLGMAEADECLAGA